MTMTNINRIFGLEGIRQVLVGFSFPIFLLPLIIVVTITCVRRECLLELGCMLKKDIPYG